MDNPYTPFYPARENFFGRESIINAFLARLNPATTEYRESKHMLIVGDGGIGKTSLLLQLEASIRESATLKGHCVSIDCGDFLYDLPGLFAELYAQLPEGHIPPSTKAKDFFTRISQSLQDGVAIGVGFPPSVSIEFSPGGLLGSPEHHRSLVRQCAVLCNCILSLVPQLDSPLVILIDQLGKIYEAFGGFLFTRFLLEVVKGSAGDGRLLVVAAIRPERKGVLEHWFQEEVFHPDRFARFPLYPLDIPAARQVVREPPAREGITFSKPLTGAILTRAGRHPYFLQLACFRIWNYLASNNRLWENPVTLRENEVDALVQESHRAIFADFGPEEQFLLRLLALAWPMLLTTMQIKEKAEAAGKIHTIDVDRTLHLLVSHKHRPVRFNDVHRAFSITHDLFAEHIRQHECSDEQVELAVLQQSLDNAPQLYEVTGATLTVRELNKLWQYREALRLEPRTVVVIVTSELEASSGDLRWTRFLRSFPSSEIRSAVARALSRSDDEMGRYLLMELANDPDLVTRTISRSALEWDQARWTWDDEWNHEASGI